MATDVVPGETAARQRETLAGRARARGIVLIGHAPVAPSVIGDAVAYFASPGASQTTGTFLRVDAGLVIAKY